MSLKEFAPKNVNTCAKSLKVATSDCVTTLAPGLLDQLGEGGTLVAPVGGPLLQNLLRIRKTAEGLVQEDLCKVVFVPLVSGTI